MTAATRLRLALVLLLAVTGAGWGDLPAQGAPHDGPCITAGGVTVVVDYRDLGGGIQVRCAPDAQSGDTGLTVLARAGFTTEGTLRDGPGFVCRINNSPSIEQTIPISGNEDYRETCVNTAPNEAHWTYWHAPNGGPWTYSQAGSANREVLIGGYEGWSFSLNRSREAPPPPRATPSHTLALPTPTPSTTTPPTVPTPATTTNPGTPAPRPTTPRATGVTTTPRTTTAPTTTRAARTATPPASPGSPTATAESVTPGQEESPPVNAPASAPTPTTSSPRSSEPPTQETSPTTTAVVDDGGPGPGTWIGLGALALAAVATGAVWRLRR